MPDLLYSFSEKRTVRKAPGPHVDLCNPRTLQASADLVEFDNVIFEFLAVHAGGVVNRIRKLHPVLRQVISDSAAVLKRSPEINRDA